MKIQLDLLKPGIIGGNEHLGTLILTKLKHPIRSFDDQVLLKFLLVGGNEPLCLGRCSPHELFNALRGLGLIS